MAHPAPVAERRQNHEAASEKLHQAYMRAGDKLGRIANDVLLLPKVTAHHVKLKHIREAPHWARVTHHYATKGHERAPWQDAADKAWVVRARIAAAMFVALGGNIGINRKRETEDLSHAVIENVNLAISAVSKGKPIRIENISAITISGKSREAVRRELFELGKALMIEEGLEPNDAYINDAIDSFFSGVLRLLPSDIRDQAAHKPIVEPPFERKYTFDSVREMLIKELMLEPEDADIMAHRLTVLNAKVTLLELAELRATAMPMVIKGMQSVESHEERSALVGTLHRLNRVNKHDIDAAINRRPSEADASLTFTPRELEEQMYAVEKGVRYSPHLGENSHATTDYLRSEEDHYGTGLWTYLTKAGEHGIVSLNGDLLAAAHDALPIDGAVSDEQLLAAHGKLVEKLDAHASRLASMRAEVISEWEQVWHDIEGKAAGSYLLIAKKRGAVDEHDVDNDGNPVNKTPEERWTSLRLETLIGSSPIAAMGAEILAVKRPQEESDNSSDFDDGGSGGMGGTDFTQMGGDLDAN